MKKKITKRAMTLLEIMIVIFIIGIIGSVVGYNMKGSLEEGKAFKSKEGARQIYEILTLEYARGDYTPEYIKEHLEEVLKHSGMVRNAKNLLKDGWGKDYIVTFSKDDFKVKSERYFRYAKEKKVAVEKFMGGTEESADTY